MVLRDAIFDMMDCDAFNGAVTLKARGVMALHNALSDIDLDFFRNYSAANSFLDALALNHHTAGPAASSLVLSMALDVGVVAENDTDAIETSLLWKGMYSVGEEEMPHGFEFAMLGHHTRKNARVEVQESQLIMGMDPEKLARAVAKAGGIENADVASAAHELERNLEGGHADDSFAATLKTALAEGPAAALKTITTHIAKGVSRILMIPLEDFELKRRSIASYCPDSMIGAEMWTWLFKEFGMDFPFQKLLAPTLTLMTLAAATRESVKASTAPLKSSGIKVARLDQNEPLSQIQVAMEHIIKIFGTVDIVVNNAAYVQTSTIEETTPEETFRQFQANTFGPINVYRAILPHMREKRAGTLVTMGTMAAWYPTLRFDGWRSAWLTRSSNLGPPLPDEPGFFRTELLKLDGNLAGTTTSRLPDYAELNSTADALFRSFHGIQRGDPRKGVQIIYDVVTSSGVAAALELPRVMPLGSDANTQITKNAQMAIDDVKKWASISQQSDFKDLE
ncbi:hypothetical protein AAE478_004037 [Parahypoxylon ruwenzoriense]